jgi:hypothetical protein
MSAEAGAIWVDRIFITPGWVELLLVIHLVEEKSVYSVRFSLGNSALPDRTEHSVEHCRWRARHYFVDERNILTGRKDDCELVIGRGKDVVNRVVRAIDDLDVPHALQHSRSGARRGFIALRPLHRRVRWLGPESEQCAGNRARVHKDGTISFTDHRNRFTQASRAKRQGSFSDYHTDISIRPTPLNANKTRLYDFYVKGKDAIVRSKRWVLVSNLVNQPRGSELVTCGYCDSNAPRTVLEFGGLVPTDSHMVLDYPEKLFSFRIIQSNADLKQVSI